MATRKAVASPSGRPNVEPLFPEPDATLDSEETSQKGRGHSSAYVYERLKVAILNMELKPGSLLDETSLSQQFDVSRSPVREALIRLNGERLVHTLRNRSTIVSNLDASTLPDYFDALQLMYRVTAKLAALNRTASQLERLKEINLRHQAAAHGDMLGTIRGNRDFHCQIAECGNNPFFVDWAQSLMDQGQRLMFMYLKRHSNLVEPTHLDTHTDLIKAIERQDAVEAQRHAGIDADVLRKEVSKALSLSLTNDIDV